MGDSSGGIIRDIGGVFKGRKFIIEKLGVSGCRYESEIPNWIQVGQNGSAYSIFPPNISSNFEGAVNFFLIRDFFFKFGNCDILRSATLLQDDVSSAFSCVGET